MGNDNHLFIFKSSENKINDGSFIVFIGVCCRFVKMMIPDEEYSARSTPILWASPVEILFLILEYKASLDLNRLSSFISESARSISGAHRRRNSTAKYYYSKLCYR